MKSTTEYDMFSEITSNREVDRSHLKKLLDSIQENNLLHLFPIVVNGDLQVIDGQHRLAAAKRLRVPIFYIVDEKVSKSDISTMNKIKKNWTPMDYINYYAIEKKPNYVDLSRFLNKYNDFSVSTVLYLLSDDGKTQLADVKNGTYLFRNQHQAALVLDLCVQLSRYITFFNDRSLVLAFKACFDSGLFDTNRFITQLEGQIRSFVKCINTRQYLEMIQEIYNYHKSSKSTVKFI